MGGFLTDGGGTDSLLELAVNTHLNPDPDPDPNPNPDPKPDPNLRRVRREGVEEQPERAVRLQVAVLRGARVAHREQAASGQPALCEALRPLDLRRGRAEGEEGVRVRVGVEW